MTTLAERPEIVGGVVSHTAGLEIMRELSFNEWRRLGGLLLETANRSLWSLGDWRVYGERFERDYHEALTQVDDSSRFVAASARVSRAFPLERRRGQLTIEFHELVVGLPVDEQDRWLDEVERQGWSRRQMQFSLGEAMEPRATAPALSVRLVEDYYRIAIAAAERRNMDPKEWVLEAIREKRDREAPELEAA